MKRLIGAVSVLAIVAALAQLVLLFRAAPAPAPAGVVFHNLPIDVPREVIFTIDTPALAQLAEDERADQLRDWLLYSVVASAGVSADELSRGFFDLPPVRYPYLAGLATFTHSETRSLALNSGGVVSLLPAGADEGARRDQLAAIADLQHERLGATPAAFHIFEYALDVGGGSAIITRRPDVPGEALGGSGEHAGVGASVGGLAPISRRTDLNGAATRPDRLVTAGGVVHAFTALTPGRAALITTPPAGTRLASPGLELGNASLERVVAVEAAGYSVEMRYGSARVADLRIQPTANGLAVGLRSLEFDAGYALASSILAAPSPAVALGAAPAVARFLHLGRELDYLVQLRGIDQVLRIAPEPAPSAVIPGTYLARVTAPDTNRPGLLLTWYQPESFAAPPFEGYLMLQLDEATGRFTLAEGGGEGPPPGRTVSVNLSAGDEPVRGLLHLATGAIYLAPDAVRRTTAHSLLGLADAFTAEDLKAIRTLAAEDSSFSYTLSGVTHGATSVFDELRRGSFDDLAGAILDDPFAYGVRARLSYADGLRDASTFVTAGDYREATLILDDLERTLGLLPDIGLRKGLVSILEGRPERAARQINAMKAVPLRDPAAYFAELNSRLAGDLDEATRVNITRLAELGHWREVRARKGLPVADVRAGLEGGTLVLELYLDALPEGVPVLVADLPSGGAAYVQDSPGLGGRDWSAGFQVSAEQAVADQRATLLALPRASLDGFSPARIYVGAGVKLEQRGPGARPQPGLHSYDAAGPSEGACAPTIAAEECARPAYAIVAHP